MLQTLLVVVIVGACAGHAIWRLLPAAAQSRAAVWLLRLPLPGRLARVLRDRATRSPGCGCVSCERRPARVERASEQAVRWVKRRQG